jgi:hypothetical protein
MPHQARATLRAAKHRNYALFMEPRTGKTKASLDAIGLLALKDEVLRVAVLGPTSAEQVWEDELYKHFPFAYTYETPNVLIENPHRPPPLVSFQFWNYEKVRWRRRGRRGTGAYRYPYMDEVERFDPDLLVCDESHRLKRAGGVAAQGVWRMVRRSRLRRDNGRPYVHLLTGTPKDKGWIDLFAPFRIMDESIFGTSKADFEDEHVVYARRPQWRIIRYRHEARLRRKVRAHSYAVSAEAAGLAGKVFTQHLYYQLTPQARRHYDEMAEEFLTEIGGGVVTASNAGARRIRLLQIAGGFTTDGKLVHKQGVRLATEYFKDLRSEGEPFVVYARFLPEVDALLEAAEAAGVNAVDIRGSVSNRDTVKRIRDFQASRVDALIFQVQSGTEAIELSRAAEVVFYSLPDGWITYWQARARVLGPNQKRPVRVSHIMARGTLHKEVLAGLIRKEDQHQRFMRNPRRYLGVI